MIVLVVLVAAAVTYALVRRRTHDDVHSVEHYHRQLHTLEEMRTHPREDANGKSEAAFPAASFKVSSSVRLTEPGRPVAPPPVPPPVRTGEEPVRFDEHPELEPLPSASSVRRQERAMEAINHRPRRLAAPLAAVAVVAALIIVLVVAGMHSNTHRPHAGTATTTTAPSHTRSTARQTTTTTTTTAPPPAVSAPQATSAQAATYRVAAASYSLALSATGGACWVQATAPGGNVLFSSVLSAGQSHTIAATGPLTVVAGAPGAFAATVDGAPVTLPPGAQSPFNLSFVPG